MSAEAGASPYLSGGLSEKGRRDSNEDAALVAVLPASPSLRAFAVLCDGMGGHNAGEVASRLAAEILKERILAFASRAPAQPPARAETEAAVRAWIADVNREIFRRGKASSEQRGMGTTLALALVLADDRLVVANVGDSRVFLVSGLSVRQLSVDHTALAEQRRALGSDSVAPEDDASNPFAHALTRSLGQEKAVAPDVRSDVTLGSGDAVLLTTDGVTDVLEAERFLTALETTSSLQEAAEEIYRLAFEAGSKDNVSVALLSRGAPTRLGLARAARAAAAEPVATAGGGGMLVAGAASAPYPEPKSRPGRRRLVGLAAGGAALAAAVAVGLSLRRPATPERSAAATPPPVLPAPASSAVAAPTATPLPAPLSSPEPPQATAGRVLPANLAGREQPRSLPPATSEPSFRTPSVLSGLKPLEYPPTPTATPTPEPPTPTATEAPAPSLPPSLPAPVATPAPPAAPAATPSVNA